MKRLKVYALAAMTATTILFTSCLSGNSETSGVGFGVVALGGPYDITNVLNSYTTTMGIIPLSSPLIQSGTEQGISLREGLCCLFTYKVDIKNQPSLQTNKYYTGDIVITKKLEPIDVNSIYDNQYLVPTENDLVIKAAGVSAYVDNRLLLGAKSDQSDKQNVFYQVYYSMDSVKEESGNRIYNLYLKGSKDSPTGSTTSEVGDDIAVNAGAFFTRAFETEKAKDKKVVNFRFKYLKSYNKDDATYEYAQSEAVSVYIPETSTEN